MIRFSENFSHEITVFFFRFQNQLMKIKKKIICANVLGKQPNSEKN